MTTANTPSKAPTGKKNNAKASSSSPVEAATAYLKGVRTEWGKISWPSKPQIWGQTIVVLVMVSIMTLGLFVLDYSLHTLITAITPHRS